MSMPLKGIVRGRTIELCEDAGIADGQRVAVFLQAEAVLHKESGRPGDGVLRSAGAWNDDPEGLDAYVEWTRRQRKVHREALRP